MSWTGRNDKGTLPNSAVQIAPRTGTAFKVAKGQRFSVINSKGASVADLIAFSTNDPREALSNGRSFNYGSKILFSTGDKLYSNRSNVMLRIVKDTVGRHNFLSTPCSKDTFRLIYNNIEELPGYHRNLAHILAKFGIPEEGITTPFNIFIHVVMDRETGALEIKPLISKAGDYIDFMAEMDLIIGLIACSAPKTNAGSFKPIEYKLY
ncbi:hypothetical protein B0J15DRAFT_571004 [Fusarium solani]|uniref:DUF1989 domain-containing protein n=1 Tax=Fusarium solani TaxID=169388 RepID=A0A9P9G7V4_FUSSL|nr:uncharacterized protein B0J15DRAFT_571004 [Fusarium solani]KAH7234528.1 hypothetical protein B0J15DRAFT_571004 [Fusarium solani]